MKKRGNNDNKNKTKQRCEKCIHNFKCLSFNHKICLLQSLLLNNGYIDREKRQKNEAINVFSRGDQITVTEMNG